jgi:TM2 domain-containing membrane protein YozV
MEAGNYCHAGVCIVARDAVPVALFPGTIGIHQFNLGRAVSVFLDLIFRWTFVPALLASFEAIGLPFVSEEQFTAAYP